VVRNAVKGGGQVLLVPSNNAPTWARPDLPATGDARLRAVEHGRWTMEAATSGVSASSTRTGRILAQTGESQPRYLDMQVRRNTT